MRVGRRPVPGTPSATLDGPPMRPLLALASLASGLLVAVSAMAGPAALPALPSSGGNAGAAAPAPQQQGHAQDPSAEARKGVVQVEQAGRPIAVGTVLAKDGRVLTSLSALAGVEQPEIRYADGTVAKARIGHKDAGWDLALLIPLTGRWLDGLVPTDTDPLGIDLRAFLPTRAGKLGASTVGVKGRVDGRSREGVTLKDLLEVDFKGAPAVPGAPLLEPNGRVVGVLVKACKDTPAPAPPPNAPAAKSAPPCSPATFAAPVYALRSFLMKTPANAVQPAPWLGLGGAPSDAGNVRGVKVVALAPGSPAEKAGLRASTDAPETIVAVDGQPIETPEQLAEAITKRSIGQTIKLLVFSAGRFREVPVTLRAAP